MWNESKYTKIKINHIAIVLNVFFFCYVYQQIYRKKYRRRLNTHLQTTIFHRQFCSFRFEMNVSMILH